MKNVKSQERTVNSEYLLRLFTLKEYLRNRTIVTAKKRARARAHTHTHTHTHTADQFPPSCAAALTFALHSTEISQLKHCTIQYI